LPSIADSGLAWCAQAATQTRTGEGVAAVARLVEGVGAEADTDFGRHDLVDDLAVGPLVEVVDQLRALVAEVAGVFETSGALHHCRHYPQSFRGATTVDLSRAEEERVVGERYGHGMDRDERNATIDTLEEVFVSLSELGADLTEEQWKTPTDLPHWSVQDNLSHLIAIERMLEGLPGTAHRASATDHVRNPIGEANENEVDARRSLSGAEVLTEWRDITARRMATLRSADDAYFAAEAMTPTGPGTVADFLHIRVLDCWAHEQDMRRALGRVGHDDGRAAALTIDRLVRTIPIVVGKRAGTPEGGTVVIRLVGPIERTIVATVVDGRARLGTEVPADALTTLTMDSTTFTCLATGRRRAVISTGDVTMPDPDQFRVRVDGDIALGTAVADSLNMMI
jgi:uncharacterized protein (TIGR03083 family)